MKYDHFVNKSKISKLMIIIDNVLNMKIGFENKVIKLHLDLIIQLCKPQKSMRNQERKLTTKREEEQEEEESDDNNDNDKDNGSGYDEMNELDRIFGTTKLN